MLGLVITLAAATAPLPPSAQEQGQGIVACVEGPAACEALPAAFEELLPGEGAYATPAVLDCRRESVPLVLSTLVGECDGTPHDASYRVSRTPDGEESRQAMSPAPRDKRVGVATCGGMPPRAPTLQLLDGQVLALAATPTLRPAETSIRYPRDSLELSTRFADPPERPPRI